MHDLSHLIHFTTGPNFLLRNRQKLAAGEQICVDSLELQ